MTYRTTRNTIDNHVGTRLRERRESLHLSQSGLGRILGVSFSQIQKYEKGTNRIGAGALYLLAGALNVDVSYFYAGLDATSEEITPRVSTLAERIALLSETRIAAVEALIASMGNGR